MYWSLEKSVDLKYICFNKMSNEVNVFKIKEILF